MPISELDAIDRKILRALQSNGKISVGELADACEIPSNMASEHLRLMQRSGFLAKLGEGVVQLGAALGDKASLVAFCSPAAIKGTKLRMLRILSSGIRRRSIAILT